MEFLNALNSKTDRIKVTYCISESSISFLDLFLYRDTSSNVLQFSTFKKPLNKYLYIPFESFHPSSNKKAFIKGELMRYARNSSSFNSFYETREKFWKRLRVIHSSFCFHCYVKYDTVTERNGFTRNLRISLAWVGLLSSRLPSTVVAHVLRVLLALSYQN